MNLQDFEAYTEQLRNTLESAPGVLALVTLGTTADPALRDQFSDHDFWLITEPGTQDGFVQDFSWLPDAETIALTVSHGPRRRTVLYRNRHKVEFAVFDVEEARQGEIERYAMLIDRADVVSLIEGVRLETQRRVAQTQIKSEILQDLCVTIWSACERHARGEYLSARQYLEQFALNKYLIWQARVDADGSINGLEPRRRLEVNRPALAAELDALSSKPVPLAALDLLEIIEREIRRKRPELDWNGVKMVQGWIRELAQVN